MGRRPSDGCRTLLPLYLKAAIGAHVPLRRIDPKDVGRARRLSLVCLWVAAAAGARADTFSAPVLGEDRGSLSYAADGRRAPARRVVKAQAGFDQPAVSSGGEAIGWLALTPNCCTSYPLPTHLVVRTRAGYRVFAEAPPIWRWAFGPEAGQVVYVTDFPHGHAHATYKLRSLKDGRTLKTYTCTTELPLARSNGPLPAWAEPVRHGCPD